MQFIPYNKKAFLLPDSINSAAMYHAKIFPDGRYIFRMHDCITGIRLTGELKEEQDFTDAVKKTQQLAKALLDFAAHVDTLRGQLFPWPVIDESALADCDAEMRICEHLTKGGKCSKYIGFCNRQIP
jgi:hypothetical protein